MTDEIMRNCYANNKRKTPVVLSADINILRYLIFKKRLHHAVMPLQPKLMLYSWATFAEFVTAICASDFYQIQKH